MGKDWARGFIKICGVTDVDGALSAVQGQASAIGVILADSPRRVTTPQAREICDAVEGSLLRCAVYRHMSRDAILTTLDELNVDVVQLHGPYDSVLVDEFIQRNLTTIRALSIGTPEFYSFSDQRVDAVLIDGPRPGSGIPHSWSALAEREFRVPVIVAGGITPDSVTETVAATKAWGVDCATGVESSLGRKDPALVSSFVINARRGFVGEERSE